MIAAALQSSVRQSWNTPEPVLTPLHKFATVGLDPCSNPDSIVGAVVEWSLERGHDGLAREWGELGLVFVNPEYGRAINAWIAKCVTEARGAGTGRGGCEIVALVPARTDTRWFADIWQSASAILFWRGRLTFLGAPAGAPFPSALVYWGNRPRAFGRAFKACGKVVYL